MGEKLMDVSLTYKGTHTPTLQAKPHTLTPSTHSLPYAPTHPGTHPPRHLLSTHLLTHSLTCTHSQNYLPNKNIYWTDRYWTDMYWTDMYWTDMYWTDRYWTDRYWTNMCTSVYEWYMNVCVCDFVSGCVYTYVCVCVHVCACL